MNKGTVGNIDGLVYDFFSFATDAILQDRKGMINPLANSNTPPFSDNADYNRQALAPFKKDVNRMLVLDLYIFSPYQHKHILIERWKINYQRNNDTKEGRPFPIINRRILTLIRTITCFLRLIPGFSILNLSKVKPSFGYQLYEWRSNSNIPEMPGDIMKYKFNSVSTSKGVVSVGVTYLNGPSIKEVLRSVESNGEHGVSRRHSNPSGFAREKESSAAIPIPSQQHSRGTSLINQRIDEYDDPTTNNSSYNSQDQFRYAPNSVETRGSVEEVQRRRSFHGTPEQLHHTSSAQEQMQQYRQGGGGGKQHAKSFDNYSGKHFQQQQGAGGAAAPLHPAESSPSGGHSYLNEGVAAGMGGGRSSRVSVPIAIAGATATTAAAHGVMRHHSGYASSSASSHSTPPFSLLEQRMSLDTPGTSYPDIAKNSPPYQQFSTSLVSTSPGFGNLMNLVNARETYRRRKSFTENNGTTGTGGRTNSGANGISAMNWKPSSSPATDSENDVRMYLTLPKSPFKTSLHEEAAAQQQLMNRLDNITLDVILYQEKRNQYGWSGSSEPSTKTSSALVTANNSNHHHEDMEFRNSNESNPNDEDEGETEDADDDVMFAFALNPHDLSGDHPLLFPPPRKSSFTLDANETSEASQSITTMDLMEEFQKKLKDFQSFNVEFNS